MEDARPAILAEYEREWDTEQIIRLDRDLFYRVMNGGACGARRRQRGDGKWETNAIECRTISVTEAQQLMPGFGMDPSDLDKL